jgi:hypothetical protein
MILAVPRCSTRDYDFAGNAVLVIEESVGEPIDCRHWTTLWPGTTLTLVK